MVSPRGEHQMKRISSGIASVWLGIGIGGLVSVVFGLVYIVVLHEPGSAFYLFAGLTFLGGSLSAIITSEIIP